MPSRADAAPRRTLPTIATALQAIGVTAAAVCAWALATPASSPVPAVRVRGDSLVLDAPLGRMRDALATLVAAAPGETLQVTLDGAPALRATMTLRALAGAGHPLALRTAAPLPAIAVAARRVEGPAASASLVVAGDTGTIVAIADAAGALDSLRAPTLLRAASLASLVVARAHGVRATAPVHTITPGTRVLVAGRAGWESRFVIAALEEAGWQVDALLDVAPTVAVRQGSTQLDSARHAAVIALDGAAPAVLRAIPDFVRGGGGAVLVGSAAASGALLGVRAGAPGARVRGEAGAEASEDEPRHGLDLVPVVTGARAVPIESRDGAIAIAAARHVAGRVVQVGYEDSWRWRMAGADDAPAAHRRWWSALVAGVARTPPLAHTVRDVLHDSLDAAPVATLAATIGLPRVVAAPVAPARAPWRPEPRLLAVIALLSLAGAWVLRRLAGVA
ncbi:MAG: hypothetical protein MUF21_00240 [Gemmatimonadaceae bacterium]|jgi:hypothetical protein|nr:hypothetical protein [Gemmatimonadaceae bacterium]